MPNYVSANEQLVVEIYVRDLMSGHLYKSACRLK